MLLACAQTCELCQMFAGASFSGEPHLLLGQTTIILTLFEVRLNQFWVRTSFTTLPYSYHSPEALAVFAHQVSPASQSGKDPNLLAVTRQGCDSDITCYLENQTETEGGLKWETDEQMEKKAHMVQQQDRGPSLLSTALLFVHLRPHDAAQTVEQPNTWTTLCEMLIFLFSSWSAGSSEVLSAGRFPNQLLFNSFQLWTKTGKLI